MNKVNGTTGFIAAVLVGMTLSYAPVQAGWDMETTKKVSKVVFKWVKMGTLIGGIVGGSGCSGAGLYEFNKDRGGSGVLLGVGLSVLILSSLYLYKQEFKPNKKNKNKDNDND